MEEAPTIAPAVIAGMGVGEIPSAALSAADAQSIEDCVVAVEDCVGSVDVVVAAVGVAVVAVAGWQISDVLGGGASGFASAPKAAAAAAAVQWVEDFSAFFGGIPPAARCRRPVASDDPSALF